MDANRVVICSDCGHSAPAKEWFMVQTPDGRITYMECPSCKGYGKAPVVKS